MASDISAIKTQLITDIETTSITQAFDGIGGDCTNYPFAEMYLGSAETDNTITSVVDRIYGSMQVMVTANDADEIETVLEELEVLWYSTAKLAALQAIGVVMIYNAGVAGPLESDNETTELIGVADFVLRVRYTA